MSQYPDRSAYDRLTPEEKRSFGECYGYITYVSDSGLPRLIYVPPPTREEEEAFLYYPHDPPSKRDKKKNNKNIVAKQQ
jgi:hypothetical protein